MSLQVWLPLNGNVNNQGLDNTCTFTNNTATVSTSGLIGSCYNFTATTGNGISLSGKSTTDFMNSYINNHSFTLSAWVKSTETDTCVICLTYGLRMYAGTTPSISLYNSDRTVTANNSNSTTDGKWHHLAATYEVNTGAICVYVDGKPGTVVYYPSGYTYASSWTNVIAWGRDPNNSSATAHYFYQGSLNDGRIYDSALSASEVQELAKGLVCHYTLNDEYAEGTTNLITTTTYNTATDSGWGGHRTTVTNYDCSSEGLPFNTCSKMVVTYDTSYGTGGGFGIQTSAGNIKVSASTTYCYSTYIKASDDFVYTNANFLYRYERSSSTAVTEAGVASTDRMEILSNGWRRFYGTFTTDASTDNINFMFFSYPGKSMIYYVGGMQVEKKDHLTPYILGTRSSLEYDSSGFGNNGTVSGTSKFISDMSSPRYNGCTQFSSLTLTHSRCLLAGTDQEWTCCAWVYPTSTSICRLNNFNNHNYIYYSANGTPLLYLNAGDNDYYRYGSAVLPINTWTHIAFVFKNSTGDRHVYFNGVLKDGSGPNKTSTPSGIPDSVVIGSGFTGYMSDYREYARALTADELLKLCHTPITIASNGSLLTQGEFIEE